MRKIKFVSILCLSALIIFFSSCNNDELENPNQEKELISEWSDNIEDLQEYLENMEELYLKHLMLIWDIDDIEELNELLPYELQKQAGWFRKAWAKVTSFFKGSPKIDNSVNITESTITIVINNYYDGEREPKPETVEEALEGVEQKINAAVNYANQMRLHTRAITAFSYGTMGMELLREFTVLDVPIDAFLSRPMLYTKEVWENSGIGNRYGKGNVYTRSVSSADSPYYTDAEWVYLESEFNRFHSAVQSWDESHPNVYYMGFMHSYYSNASNSGPMQAKISSVLQTYETFLTYLTNLIIYPHSYRNMFEFVEDYINYTCNSYRYFDEPLATLNALVAWMGGGIHYSKIEPMTMGELLIQMISETFYEYLIYMQDFSPLYPYS